MFASFNSPVPVSCPAPPTQIVALDWQRILLLATLIVAGGSFSSAQDQDSGNRLPEWPDDPRAVVLEFDFVGGFRIPRPPGDTPPRLRVYADGSAVSGGNGVGFADIEFQIGADQARQLCQRLLAAGLGSLETEEIRKEIEETGRPIRIADAPSTRFVVITEDGLHAVQVYALSFVARQYPEIESLEKLLELQEELMGVVNRGHLGNDAEEILAKVNGALKEEDSAMEPFRLDELQSATTRSNGDRSVKWSRILDGRDPPVLVSASYEDKGDPAEGKAEVQIRTLAGR